MKHKIFIRHHCIGLRLIGAFPGITQFPGFRFSIGIMCFFLFFEIWNAIAIYSDLDKLMNNFVSTIGVILGLFKIIMFRLKRRNLMLAINTIIEDWNTENQGVLYHVMADNFIRSQLVSKLIIVLYNAMNFTYFLKTIVSYVFDAIEDRKFLAEVTFPIDGKQSPMYEAIVAGQFLTSSICFNSHALIEGLLVTMVLHASSKLNALRHDILSFKMIFKSDFNNERIILFSLKRLSEKHTRFIKFYKIIQDIFSNVTFFHIYFLIFIQAISGYMFIDALERGAKIVHLLHYAILTMSFLISLGYYCTVGEYLTIQSERLFVELYNCIWYEFPIHEKKLINFMLMNAGKPVNLKVGKFSNLSLINFTNIIKTSFSYLSLVRAIR